MKKETFVKLIKVLEEYKNKSNKFGEAVAKAYTEIGGLEKDFAVPYAYEFPYGSLMDGIVKAIANDFADENYSAETAEDFINWWLWEADFGKGVWYDTKTNEFKDFAEVTFGDRTYRVNTPSKLYDAIIRDKKNGNRKIY